MIVIVRSFFCPNQCSADPAQEARPVGPVDQAVIVTQREGHDGARQEFAVDIGRFDARARYSEYGDFGWVDDGGKARK